MNDEDMVANWIGPVVRFVDGSPSYCNGFEAGQIWCELSSNRRVRDRLVHTSNVEQIRLIAGYFDVDVRVEQFDPEWSYITIVPRSIGRWLLSFFHWLFW